MRTQMVKVVEQILQLPTEELSANKAMVDELVKVLVDITGVELHPEIFLDEHATETAVGKAVSMTTAAQCAEEYMRTQVFLRGVFQAIQDQLQQRERIDLLYAGSGPFGLLVVPLLPLFQPGQVRLTLLDIHQESLDALEKVLELLEVQGSIEAGYCVDILQWTPPEGQRYDLIVSETMKAMLDQEPQLSIFAHLVKWLRPEGQLVPQSINISAWISGCSDRRKVVNGHADLPIGAIFQLNSSTAQAIGNGDSRSLAGVIGIPDYPAELTDLKFTTEIQVYGQHWLTENQCSLNLPKIIRNARPEVGSQLQYCYQIGQYPHFEFDYRSLPDPVDQPLTESSDLGSLGIPHLKRAWHKAQLDKRGLLDVELRRREWLLDQTLLQRLNWPVEEAMSEIYRHDRFDDLEASLVKRLGNSIFNTELAQL